MACMCGDLYCWSCGPAQGNSKCHICGKWDMDGGCDEPEKCLAIAQEQDRAENELMAKWIEEDRKVERFLKDNPNYLKEQ